MRFVVKSKHTDITTTIPVRSKFAGCATYITNNKNTNNLLLGLSARGESFENDSFLKVSSMHINDILVLNNYEITRTHLDIRRNIFNRSNVFSIIINWFLSTLMENEEALKRESAIKNAKRLSKMLYGEDWCRYGWYDTTFLPVPKKVPFAGDLLIEFIKQNNDKRNK